MASTGQKFINQLTISNQAVEDLKQLLQLAVLQQGSISETLTMETGVSNGKKVAGIGEMEPVGRPANGCDPEWRASNVATQEKTWELGAYEIAEHICYTDIESTMARFAIRKGTQKADLTGTDFMDIVVEPTLSTAMEKMLWRLLWFGDKAAKNIADGGVITNSVDTELFSVCDGLFKRLFELSTSKPSQRVTIAANTQTTYAAQIAAIRESGVATGIFEKMVYDAPMKLRQKSDKIMLCTQTMADALAADIKGNNKGSDLQWESLFDGFVSMAKWNGHTILALPIWDEMIQTFEDNGTSWNKPHRLVFASKETLKAGVESTDMVAQLDIWFEKKDQRNYMLAKDELGSMIWEDTLTTIAY